MTKFIFDLDGTVTSQETLPLISEYFGISKDIKKLTKETIQGNIPFVESFIRRVNILGKLPVDEISNLLEKTLLYPKIIDFINKNKDKCAIATGNLDCWIDKLSKKVGCICHSSSAEVKNNRVTKITQILKKESIVEHYKNLGEKVVFIGDGNNDMEAMRIADISIACGLTHRPAPSILTITNYLVFEEESLCRQLNQLL